MVPKGGGLALPCRYPQGRAVLLLEASSWWGRPGPGLGTPNLRWGYPVCPGGISSKGKDSPIWRGVPYKGKVVTSLMGVTALSWGDPVGQRRGAPLLWGAPCLRQRLSPDFGVLRLSGETQPCRGMWVGIGGSLVVGRDQTLF